MTELEGEPVSVISEEIVWSHVENDDWGGGIEQLFRAENVEHAGCSGDVLQAHLLDLMGGVVSVKTFCGKCSEDLSQPV